MSAIDHFRLPDGSRTCHLSIIDTTTNAVSLSRSVIEPVRRGHEYLNLPTYSFLIVNDETQKHVLFDLGMRKDWWNTTPTVLPFIEQHAVGLKIDKDVPEILEAAGIRLEKITAVVLSHSHLDHVGNMSLFPLSTDAIVGPGFKKSYGPFYPEGEYSTFHDYEFKGRNLIELDFSLSELRIGGFKAHDYFGDGSFYLLHTPGHTKEHLAGLVRTTLNPDTFVLLGGDICHFMGMLRPTKEQPMPSTVAEDVNMPPVFSTPYPNSYSIGGHPTGLEKAQTTPYYNISSDQSSVHANHTQAQETVCMLARFDTHPQVLVTIAHDPSLGEVLPLFPNGKINDWKKKMYKEKCMWNWVKQLPRDGKAGMPLLVDGLYRDGKKVRSAPKIEGSD